MFFRIFHDVGKFISFKMAYTLVIHQKGIFYYFMTLALTAAFSRKLADLHFLKVKKNNKLVIKKF